MRGSSFRWIAASLGLWLLPSGEAAAARPDRSVVAGAQALPNLRFLANEGSACTHYVAMTGSDSNPGSQAAPWRTVGKALRTLQAGQVGCVASGTYVENATQPVNNGEEARPIVLKRQPGSPTRPVIWPNGPVAVFHMDRDYWIVDGLDIDLHGERVTGFRWWTGADFGVLRNSRLHGGTAGSNVYIAGRDFLMEDNEVYDNFQPDDRDSHGIVVPADVPNIARILIRRNVVHDNGGDGFQCEGYGNGTDPSTPRDITLEDNRMYTSPVNWGRVEQAVDIKSCRQVTIRGSVRPDANEPGAAGNKFYGFREKDGQVAKAGSAMVIHYSAKKVLVENTRIWNSCNGIGVGRGEDSSFLTEDVVIRRNLVFDMYRNAASGSRCRGYGVTLNRVNNVDIYHNTFDNVPWFAVGISNDNTTGTPNQNIDLWNNVVRNGYPWMRVTANSSKMTGFVSDRNFFWNTSTDLSQIQVDGSPKTLAQWRTFGGSQAVSVADPTSRNQDPQIVDNPSQNDYFLQWGSPARDVAINNTGALYTDAGPDVGFRETYPSDLIFTDGFQQP